MKDNRLHSQADCFASKYESPALGVLVSLVAVVAMVPYPALRFQGLGLIVAALSLWFFLQSGQGIVLLLLLGYSLVPRLFLKR